MTDHKPTPDEVLAKWHEVLKRPWHHPAYLREGADALREAIRQRDGLEAARIAYASEFDGDVGSIHENIRKLKAQLQAARKVVEAARIVVATYAIQVDGVYPQAELARALAAYDQEVSRVQAA